MATQTLAKQFTMNPEFLSAVTEKTSEYQSTLPYAATNACEAYNTLWNEHRTKFYSLLVAEEKLNEEVLESLGTHFG